MSSMSLTGQKLGHYPVLKPLRAGGGGLVYLANDERLDRRLRSRILRRRTGRTTTRALRFERNDFPTSRPQSRIDQLLAG